MKYVFGALIIAVCVALIATGIHLWRVSLKNKKEMTQYEQTREIAVKPFPKTLVIYYSLTGRTRDIAKKIAEKTNADTYEVQTTKPLPKGALLHLEVKNSLKNKSYPEINGNFPDLTAYDIIFVGAPVWWYTVATPMLSFLNKTDFQGKKVVPFSTQGSNVGTYFEDFAANAKNAVPAPSASFNNLPEKYDQAVNNKIAVWLNKIIED